jgi:hypothetical protein
MSLLARLLPQYANPVQRPETGPWVRSWPVPVRRRRLRDSSRRGLALRIAAPIGHTEIVLAAQGSTASPGRQGRGGFQEHVWKALVWRALLAARAIGSRAGIARWQGLSRARVTLGHEASPMSLMTV